MKRIIRGGWLARVSFDKSGLFMGSHGRGQRTEETRSQTATNHSHQSWMVVEVPGGQRRQRKWTPRVNGGPTIPFQKSTNFRETDARLAHDLAARRACRSLPPGRDTLAGSAHPRPDDQSHTSLAPFLCSSTVRLATDSGATALAPHTTIIPDL